MQDIPSTHNMNIDAIPMYYMNALMGPSVFSSTILTISKVNAKALDGNWNHSGKSDLLRNPKTKVDPKQNITLATDPILEAIYILSYQLEKLQMNNNDL
jgi:hypothetical protein